MNAVIDESMRVYPAFPHGVNRISPHGGETVDGHYVPEGVSYDQCPTILYTKYVQISVSVYQYATYHQPSNFYLADSFIPERWLGTDTRFANDKLDAFQPFSYGPRGCIGKK
jgi:cytochrome P450